MTKLTLTGNTYGIKEAIKALGFRWNPEAKAWSKTFEDKAEAEEIASRWTSEGVYGTLAEVKAEKPKRYPVKESYIFNLESMHDKCFCLMYDIQEGKIQTPFTVAGKTINDESDLYDLIEEAGSLKDKAWRGGVTGKDYGRIKEIVAWRVNARYTNCLASGMSEAEAGRCFEDM